MKYSNIRVLVARSLEDFDSRPCTITDCREGFDTVKEAKEWARYALTPEYLTSNEMTEPVNVARVMVDEEDETAWRTGGFRSVCLVEYWRKGWKPAPLPVEVDE